MDRTSAEAVNYSEHIKKLTGNPPKMEKKTVKGKDLYVVYAYSGSVNKYIPMSEWGDEDAARKDLAIWKREQGESVKLLKGLVSKKGTRAERFAAFKKSVVEKAIELTAAENPVGLAKRFKRVFNGIERDAKGVDREIDKLEKAVQVKGGGRRPSAEATPSWNKIKDANRSIQSMARVLQRTVDEFEKLYKEMD